MSKLLAKVGHFTAYDKGKYVKIEGKNNEVVYDIWVDKSDFFLLEKLLGQVKRGYLRGE